MTENERFGLVFTKTGSINSGTDVENLSKTKISSQKVVLFGSQYRNHIKKYTNIYDCGGRKWCAREDGYTTTDFIL